MSSRPQSRPWDRTSSAGAAGSGAGNESGDLLDGLGEQAQGGAALVGGHDQGRRQPHGALTRLQDQQAAAEAGQLDLLGQLAAGELDPEHQPDPADVLDQPGEAAPQPRQPLQQQLPLGGGVGQQLLGAQDLEGGQAGRAGHGAAAVGGAVGALGPAPQLVAGQEGAEGQARGDPLGRDQHVRLDPGVLDRPHPPGPAHARLDLVGHEQDAVALADGLELLEPARGRGDVAALALDRLDEHGRDLARVDLVAEQGVGEPVDGGVAALGEGQVERAAVAVAVGGVQHPGQQRPEPGVVLGLGGGQADRAVAAAVEGAVEADHVLAAGGRPGQLQRPLDGLGPGVGEEGPDRAGHGGGRGQGLGVLGVDGQVEVAGRVVEQVGGLAADRLDHPGVGVAGRADGDAGVEVEEQVAVDVLDQRAGPPPGHQRRTPGAATGWSRPRPAPAPCGPPAPAARS